MPPYPVNCVYTRYYACAVCFNKNLLFRHYFYMQKNMLDFVFAVDDPVTWHTMNLLQNRKHYSILKLLGPAMISSIQSDHGAAMYYNTLVPMDGRVKISKSSL